MLPSMFCGPQKLPKGQSPVHGRELSLSKLTATKNSPSNGRPKRPALVEIVCLSYMRATGTHLQFDQCQDRPEHSRLPKPITSPERLLEHVQDISIMVRRLFIGVALFLMMDT